MAGVLQLRRWLTVPNDPFQQVVFLREISSTFLRKYANERLVLGGDLNCVISTLDKRGGRPININRKESFIELQASIRILDSLLDSWRFKTPDLVYFIWTNLTV